MRKKQLPPKEKEHVTRSYLVPEPVLTLALGLEALLEQQSLPMEYRKVGYECLKKIETMAGLREKKYEDFDIMKYEHQVNIDYQKNIGR